MVVVELSLQVAVAAYCAVEPSFTDAAPVTAMLVRVTVGADIEKVFVDTLCSPWFGLPGSGVKDVGRELVSYSFPYHAT
jgi:hypothetical protein